MFVHFISRQGRNLLVNIKDISFVLQKGVFCELHIRGIEGHVVVEDDFSELTGNGTRLTVSAPYDLLLLAGKSARAFEGSETSGAGIVRGGELAAQHP